MRWKFGWGTPLNRDGIETQVAALVGTRDVYHWGHSGSGFGSFNPRILHIGKGKAQIVTSLEID